jgi:hypothetical protein
LTVTGDLKNAEAWQLLSLFMGSRVSEDATLNLSTKSIPESVTSVDAHPFPDGDAAAKAITWAMVWREMLGLGLTINVTLDGLTSADAANASALTAVFAGEYATRGTNSVDIIPLKEIVLISTDLVIPPTLSVDVLSADAKSTLDLSRFNDAAVTKFAGRVKAASGATLIVPTGTTDAKLREDLATLFGGADKVPATLKVKVGVDGEARNADEIMNPKSSSGCDAGFGLGGVLLLAGAALIGRKRG